MRIIKKQLWLAAIGLLTITANAAEKPNVLFIAIDDLKPLLGCYGDPIAKTPNFDRLASMGMTFTNAHCNQAVCGPSRASLMTGLRPDRTKVHDLKTITREVTPWVTTLPELFRKSGYTTLGVGKIYDPRSVDKKSDAASWSEPFILHNLDYSSDEPAPVIAAYQGAAQRKAFKELTAEGLKGYGPIHKALKKQKLTHVTESADVPDDAYADGAIALHGVKYIQAAAKAGTPHFIAVGFKKPHLPFVAPKKYWDMYDRAKLPLAEFQQHAKDAPNIAYHDSNELRSYSGTPKAGPVSEPLQRELIHGYYACVSYIDAQLGLLLDELEKQKLTENTVIVIWGDHGWHLGDHGMWCKHTTYEQATRSPLIFAGPGIKKGLKTSAPTEFVDIYATLCDLTGTKMPENLDGISAKPVLDGSQEKIREYAVSQWPNACHMGYALRNDRYRYVVWVKDPADGTPAKNINVNKAEELYDYQTDPLEKINIAKSADQAERIAAFRKQANAFLLSQAERIAKEPK